MSERYAHANSSEKDKIMAIPVGRYIINEKLRDTPSCSRDPHILRNKLVCLAHRRKRTGALYSHAAIARCIRSSFANIICTHRKVS